MKGALFVIDCLRSDVFPKWFLDKYSGTFYKRFFVCLMTPASLSSMLLGRHLQTTDTPFPYPNCLELFYKRPPGESLFQALSKKNIKVYCYSDELLVRKGWWTKEAELLNNFTKLNNPNVFLFWHTYRAHLPVIYHGNLDFLLKKKQEYLKNVEIAFREIEHIVDTYKFDKFIVMGDHGEEFFEDREGDLDIGHGGYKKWLITDNIIFTGCFISGEETKTVEDIISYKFLYNTILRWYGL